MREERSKSKTWQISWFPEFVISQEFCAGDFLCMIVRIQTRVSFINHFEDVLELSHDPAQIHS